jgi:hypothetical protein
VSGVVVVWRAFGHRAAGSGDWGWRRNSDGGVGAGVLASVDCGLEEDLREREREREREGGLGLTVKDG